MNTYEENKITIIITNRGGEFLDYVIDNFKKEYQEENIEFIIINQEDDNLFLRGQLYNIAFKYVNSEYILIVDNDVINLHDEIKLNLIDLYNLENRPFICFDTIAQCLIDKNGDYKVKRIDEIKYGEGAYVFLKYDDFKRVNGFSNLCFGWGAEDNILRIKLKNLKRLHTHAIGHISHPTRRNNFIETKLNNNKILTLYRNKKIKNDLDGYNQTTYEEIYNQIDGNVRKIGVKNINVVPDFEYMSLYKEAQEIIKKDMSNKIENKGVSICITAYNAANTIKETLDSIITQTWFVNHTNWEILVGIDNCKETLDYMKTIMNNYKNLRVFMMDSNKGTYVTTNTLMNIAQYDILVRFDADDLMLDNYIEELMNAEEGDVYRFYYKWHPKTHKKDLTKKYITRGQIAMTKETFYKFGGYRPWLCAADYEFLERVKKYVKEVTLENTFLYKKLILTSLMNDEKTKYPDSEIRKNYHKLIDNQVITCIEDAQIEMEVNTYKEICSEIYNYSQTNYMGSCIPINYYHPNTKEPGKLKVKRVISPVTSTAYKKVLANAYQKTKIPRTNQKIIASKVKFI